ncbi:MAG: HEAT repeat domain-containing protein, partial [Candidatus Sumerlaeota bacterium]|nr:HEAT repeat domain-containing protein [Candidatus Sumerlaeota bacterium]
MKIRFLSCLALALGLGAVAPMLASAQTGGGDPYKALIKRDYGTAIEEMTAIEKEIQDAKPNQYPAIEARLIAVLDTPGATMPGRQFTCEMLRTIGSDKCIPAVAKLLTDDKLSHSARRVLLAIKSPAAGAALKQALGQTQGKTRIGIIETIGDRGDADSLDALKTTLKGADDATAGEVFGALAKIGGAPAADILDTYKASGPLYTVWGHAYLRCAMTLAAADAARSEKMVRGLAEGDTPLPVKAAAFGALAQLQKEQAVPMILKTLDAKDALMRRAALGAVIAVPGHAATEAFAKQLSGLPAETKATLLGALAARGDAEGLTDLVNKLATDRDTIVQEAAAKALARLGAASSVAILSPMLKEGAVGAQASQSLTELRAQGVPEALIKQTESGDAAVRAEVIGVLAARGQSEALPAMRKSAGDNDSKVRAAAIKAMGKIGAQEEMKMLSEAILSRNDKGERESIANAMSAIGARLPDKATRCDSVLQVMSKANAEVKVQLLSVLAALGGDKALQAARTALGEQGEVRKAALRALGEWTDAAPMKDLQSAAKDDKDETNRILAFRGYVKMIGLSAE